MEAEALALIAASIGGVATAASNVLVSRFKVRVAAAAVARTSASTDGKVAFDNLLVVVDALRRELAEVRAELEEERGSRKAADNRAYALREEVHALRNVLSKNGIMLTVPAPAAAA